MVSNNKLFFVHPNQTEEVIQVDEHIFQMGWNQHLWTHWFLFPLSQPVNEEMFLSDFGLSAPEPSQPEATHAPETTVEVCKAAVFVEGMETTKSSMNQTNEVYQNQIWTIDSSW